jgi:hypothetical protein
MTVQDVVGSYQIIGTNQDDTGNTYKGELLLSLQEDDSINAEWLINNTQKQFGTGFFLNNQLIINFYYTGEDDTMYRGTVNYKCLTKNILEGIWTEEFGNPEFLGTENCFKVSEGKQLLE